MKKHPGIVLCLALFLGLSPLAHGSGFLIYEHGAAAMGMAGAFVSIGSDASTVFHNPAGMSMLNGTHISLGGTVIIPKGSLALPNWPDPTYKNVDQADQTFLAPNFYLTHRFGKKIAAGIGVFAPYGLGTKWPEEYPLRYLGTSNEMQTIFINPSISYLVSDSLSIGGGISYVTSKLSLNLVRLVEDFAPYGWVGDVPASLDGATGNAVAFNLGMLYKTGTYSLGATWRSAFDIKYEGDITLDTSGIPVPFRAMAPTTGSVTTTFKFPDIFTFGGSFKLVEQLTVAVDAQYYTWNRYDKYVIDITYPTGPAEPETVLENWKNSWIFRFGLQYQLNESLALRGGVVYDQTPQPVESSDPNLPDADRLALTAGIGYKIGRVHIDAAYQYEKFSDRTSPNRGIYPFGWGEGTYKTAAHLFGISLGYGF